MLPCKVETINFDEMTQMGVVILSYAEGKRALPIWVGILEAHSIQMKLQGTNYPRPLTHDLIKTVVDTTGIKVEYVLINDISQNTFFAQLHLVQNDKKYVIDSRPSDAIAIALRVNAPIYVEEKVVNSSGVDREEFDREQKEKLYKTFLESLPEDVLGKYKH